MNNQTKKMTEGAMMVAIVGMLLFINRQLAGMLEMVMYWVLTFPILMYTCLLYTSDFNFQIGWSYFIFLTDS